jgi:YrbI family 3-deoxy-D-manno-octulosonate 8-phosphate phosphatase
VITSRTSQIVKLRAAELGVEIVRQGFEDKRAVVVELLAELRLAPEQVAYVGDDLPDLQVFGCVGLGIAVADACAELREAAGHVTAAPGGHGAVRELIETLLKAQGRWDDLVSKFRRP